MKQVAFVMFLVAASAFAHHSFSGTYQLDQQVTLEGKIASLVFRNPHSVLELDARGADGRTERWTIELGAALPLSQSGIAKDTLKTGDEITVTVSPRRAETGPGAKNGEGVLRTLRRPSDRFEWGFKPGEVPKEWMAEDGPCSLCGR